MPLEQPPGAAFGFYRPGGRRPEPQNDRTAAADAPLSALRGLLASTLGFGGDMEGLGRMVIPGVSNTPYFPDSEYFRGVLPGRSLQETPTGRAFTELGGLFGSATPTVKAAQALGAGARLAGSGAMTLGRAGERFAERVVPQILERGGPGAELLQGLAQGSRSQVVKPKGGNWLAGSLEHVTEPLKTPLTSEITEQINRMGIPHDPQAIAEATAYNNWIDSKLKNYVKNEMSTPEDPLRALAEKWSVDKPGLLAEAEAKLAGLNAKTRELAAQRGVPEEWLTSHRQDVLAAERAHDTLEHREALHTQGNPNEERWVPEYLEQVRRSEGFPYEGMGRSEPAKAWEQLADEAMNVAPAGSHLRGVLAGSNLEANPWLAKVTPETRVYHTGRSNELGFDHLTDELRNALNSESGLPAELLMKYADLPKKTMTDVVTRVADINAWRAAQKAEADLAKANSPAVFTHKEYPEQGVAWKQLKKPEDTLPAGYTTKHLPKVDIWGVYDPMGGVVSHGATEKEALGLLDREGRIKTLSDALKYEGDMMQHCVGGYCPDVSSGKSQIYSLRDERGRPHATIEVQPGKGDPISDKFKDLSPEVKQEIRAIAEAKDPSGTSWDSPGKFLSNDVAESHRNLIRETTLERFPEWTDLKPLNKILQIKGLKNGPVDEKYLPMVQDFVRSSEWSDVADLHHTGLYSIKDVDALMPKGFKMSRNARTLAMGRARAAGEAEGYLTLPEYETLLKKHAPEDQWLAPRAEPGFAAGGYVDYDPQHADHLADNVRRGFAAGGTVNTETETDPYDETKIHGMVTQLHKEMTNGY